MKPFSAGAEIPRIREENLVPRLRRAFWLGAGGLVLIGLTFALFAWLDHRNLELVLESQRTGRLAREARSLSLDRHAAIRGYLLSGNRISLGPEFASRRPLKEKMDSLLMATRENASQSDRAAAIRNAIGRWERGFALPALEGERNDAVSRAAQDLAGKELFDSIRSAFNSFLAGEQRIFSRRVQILAFLQQFSYAAVFAEIVFLLAVLAWISHRSLGQARILIHQREQIETQAMDLQQQAAELEEQAMELEEQTDEATRTANELLAANEKLEATVNRLKTAESVAQSARSQHQEAQSLLDFVLNNAPVGVALFDRQSRVVRVNAAAAAMTGVAASQHGARTLDELAPEEISDVLGPVLERVLATGEAVENVPLAAASADDPFRERHFLCSVFPVSIPTGAAGAGAVMLETTQYRQLEEQLLQSQKMEAVGRLAGGIAHDFNNMLTAIKSYSEILLADMQPGTQESADMSEIVAAADKATALTRQLLAFSRQQVLRPSRVDLNATIEGLRKMLRRLVPNDIQLNFSLAPGLWPVVADATELERVILNLVLNARDAMPEGGELSIQTSNVEIDADYAGTHADTKPGPYAMIAVTDNGEGMTKDVREKLFEPFFTTKEKGKGTGLGLSSAYGIVKQSGGFIWVYSEVDKGTTFKIYLPRAEEAKVKTPTTPKRNKRLGAETILLVEDDEKVREVATRILRNNGYRVLEAENGADALRICESEEVPVDLIVTDLVMPEMGGSELAARVREMQPDARILFTSGYTEDAVVRQSLVDPDEAFIEKPFTPATLARKAREVLDAANGG